MLHIKFTSKPFDKIESQCAVITLFADDKPLAGNAALLDWRLNGRLSQVILKNRFEAGYGETLLMPAEGRIKARDILVIGLGASDDFSEARIADFTHLLLDLLNRKKIQDFVIRYSDIIAEEFEWRNSIRLLVSQLHDFPNVEAVRLCEGENYIIDAKRRHMDFGMNIEVSFDTLAA